MAGSVGSSDKGVRVNIRKVFVGYVSYELALGISTIFLLIGVLETTFLLRLGVSAISFWVWIETRKVSDLIDSPRLKRILRRIGIAFLAFGVARLIANFLDTYLEFGIGLFSNIVNIGFYLSFVWIFYRQRKRIEAAEFDSTGGRRITPLIEAYLDELQRKKRLVDEAVIEADRRNGINR